MEEVLKQAAGRLLEWYGANKRELPWRSEPTAYRVWVSEVMLQQTRIEAVKPYFERFMSAFPTVRDLAEAEEGAVLKLWEGLGYYSRARNLHKAAKQVVAEHDGELPGTVEGLLKLPGVGAYTAGAVASIAFGVGAPAVDGNVVRVACRLLCREDDAASPSVRKSLEREIAQVLPEGQAGEFNQAVMELGETVCVSGAPKCGDCPLADICKARELGVEASLPVRSQKNPRKVEKRTVFLLTCGGRAAFAKRPETGLLAGLWELPGCEGHLNEGEARKYLKGLGLKAVALEPLPEAKHIFSHLEWHMAGWAGEVQEAGGSFTWAGRAELEGEIALPSAFKAYRRELLQRVK